MKAKNRAAQQKLKVEEQATKCRPAHAEVKAKSRVVQQQLETEEQATKRRRAHAEVKTKSRAAQQQLETEEQATERRPAHAEVKAKRPTSEAHARSLVSVMQAHHASTCCRLIDACLLQAPSICCKLH